MKSQKSKIKYSLATLIIAAIVGVALGIASTLLWFFDPNTVIDLTQSVDPNETYVEKMEGEAIIPQINEVVINDGLKRLIKGGSGPTTVLCTTEVCVKKVPDPNNPGRGRCITKKIIVKCK